MGEFAMAHPWMVFILAALAIESTRVVFVALVRRVRR